MRPTTPTRAGRLSDAPVDPTDAQASRGSTLRWGQAQPDPLATQGCTYPRPSAAGQTGTSHNLGRPRGGGEIEIRLFPSRDGLEKVRLVRRTVACWAMAGRVRCSARLEGNWFIPPPCSSVYAHLLIFRTWLLRQLVKILDKGHHRAIEAMYARVCRFDDVIFIGRVSAAAVAETEVTGR